MPKKDKAAIEYDAEDNILVGRVLGIADTLVFSWRISR